MPRSRLRTSAAALVAALALGAAGCGVSLDDGQAADVRPGPSQQEGGPTTTVPILEDGSFEGTGGAVYLREAAEATAEVTTQKISLVMEMSGIPMMGDIAITAEGAFDNESEQGQLTMDMSDVFGAMEGSSAELPPDAGLMDIVTDGGTTYLRSPLFAMLSGEDAEWFSVATEDFTSSGSLNGGAQSDPDAFLKFFEGAGDEVTELGTEDVRGVETKHISTNLDLREMMEEAGPDERAEFEESLEGLGEGAEAFTTIPAEAWIDADGYVRKFTMSFDFSEVDGGSGELGDTVMAVTVEMYDFNEPVEIEIPDPSEVADLDPSLLED